LPLIRNPYYKSYRSLGLNPNALQINDYKSTNLDSHIQAIVLPQLAQAEEAQIWNYKSILDQLCRVNDNPNKVQEAEDKLLSMKQGTDSLHAYMAKFERVLYEARGHDWPDVNKISTLRIAFILQFVVAFLNNLTSLVRTRISSKSYNS
jgi:hypothetical protein